MLTPVVCKTCGFPVGDKVFIFQAERKKMINSEMERLNVTADNLMSASGVSVDLSGLYLKLGIRGDCCKITISTAEEFNTYY